MISFIVNLCASASLREILFLSSLDTNLISHTFIFSLKLTSVRLRGSELANVPLGLFRQSRQNLSAALPEFLRSFPTISAMLPFRANP